MSRKSPPPGPALLVVGALFSSEDAYARALPLLEAAFGELGMESATMPWRHSRYYEAEMGGPLLRRFLFFKNLILQDMLAPAKVKTVEIEAALSVEGKRTVNLDPGYLTPAKLVLASNKDYSHRIYLGSGVYAEVTLRYSKGKRAYLPLENTYLDFKDPRYQRVFSLARVLLGVLLSAPASGKEKIEVNQPGG